MTTTVQAWLMKLYIETVLLFDTQSPFKSAAIFYKGITNQSDVEGLTLDGDMSRESVKVRRIESSVQDIKSPLTTAIAHQLVHLYVQFCRSRLKKSRKTTTIPSAFTSIKQFYRGLDLDLSDIERLESIASGLIDEEKKIVEEAQRFPKRQEWERKDHEERMARRAELKAKCIARDRRTIQRLIGCLSLETEKLFLMADDPLVYIRDHLPFKGRMLEKETGIDLNCI
jgi:hypothetical protein